MQKSVSYQKRALNCSARFVQEISHILLGDCRNADLVEELFGSVSELARLVEKHGNNLEHKGTIIKYDPEKDIHTFWTK